MPLKKGRSVSVLHPCPICGSTNVVVYQEDREDSLHSASIGSSRKQVSPGRILRCTACRFGFRQKRSFDQSLADLYRNMDTQVYELETQNRNWTASRHLAIVEHYIRRGSLLDVGCAAGLFLQHAANTGWQVSGVEPSETLSAKASQLLPGRIYQDVLENVISSLPLFDAVTLWDVLEHVPDPVTFLGSCAGLLKPGGYLFLNVPDLESKEARWLGSRWPLLLPEHLNYFTRPSLELCARKAGLTHIAFGRRPVRFSIEYVSYRLAQHRIPGAALFHHLARNSLGKVSIPIMLGETYGVWRNGNS